MLDKEIFSNKKQERIEINRIDWTGISGCRTTCSVFMNWTKMCLTGCSATVN